MENEFAAHEWTDIWDGAVHVGHDGHDHGNRRVLQHEGHSSMPTEDHSGHSAGSDTMDHSAHDVLGGPAVNLWYPVFSDLQSDGTEVAILSITTRWDSFLLPNLPATPTGLVVVVSSTCDQVFTFEITGEEVLYLGPGDHHEATFDSYNRHFYLAAEGSIFTNISLSESFCPYKATVYPSTKMRKEFEADIPVVFALCVASIFLFTILVFVFYDYLVERRQKFLAEKAEKSDAIVSALFPQFVRERLFDNKSNRMETSIRHLSVKANSVVMDEQNRIGSAPIADLFINSTVMFGDIAGFTAWSSSRQPVDVFVLLETLYGAFDVLAKSMQVFKVETIGDCYVAVTGLPVAQADHHLRMVRFARKLLLKMGTLTSKLEVTLGPDTTELGFRIGLNSGAVTAGVLRGERSRFQLFGDTVNMVSSESDSLILRDNTLTCLLSAGVAYGNNRT